MSAGFIGTLGFISLVGTLPVGAKVMISLPMFSSPCHYSASSRCTAKTAACTACRSSWFWSISTAMRLFAIYFSVTDYYCQFNFHKTPLGSGLFSCHQYPERRLAPNLVLSVAHSSWQMIHSSWFVVNRTMQDTAL